MVSFNSVSHEIPPPAEKATRYRVVVLTFQVLAELNGLEPSSAWLTTKCLTSRPQFRKCFQIADLRFQILNSACLLLLPAATFFWVGRRELNPHLTRSQCDALPLSYDPHQSSRLMAGAVSRRSASNRCRLPLLPTAPAFCLLSFGGDDETRTRKSAD